MDDTFSPTEAYELQLSRRRWRRRLAVAGLLVLVLAVLALIPPLVNVNRYQRRITSTLSASLGRPVHLDSVTLHLLPFPGFTLTNFVVSEDPAFGAEPTIRANSVEAHIRLSSLWRRQVEFSRVRFLDPSLNLVRNPEGRWNLDSVLIHAARIDAAPTAQPTAGQAPRFPYIEATGARVNIKLVDEKMPFSLTDTDFALWLPTAQQWRIRLEGRPSRTDANIGDPGTVRLEGALQHAARLEDVPVDLRASWHDAPLGEATRLLSGDDMGWRGTVHIDASLQGPLGAAAVRANVTLDQLRRADFVPAAPLDLAAECTATANTATAELHDASCSLPVTGGSPLILSSPAIDLARPLQAAATLSADKLPLPWLFGWLKVFSARIPAAAAPAGDLSAHLSRTSANPIPSTPNPGPATANVSPATWSGSAQLTLPATGSQNTAQPTTISAQAATLAAQPTILSWNVTPTTMPGCTQALTSAATPVSLPAGIPLTLASELSPCGYILHATGTASEVDLTNATRNLPELTDGLHAALAPTPGRFDVTCTRTWTAGQTCTATHPTPTPHKPTKHHR